MATVNQISFIERLCDERPTGRTYVLTQLAANKVKSLAELSTREASNVIGVLLSEPKADTEEAKPGYYVRDGKAFKVQTNKAGTHTYALVWSGTRWDYDPGTAKNLVGLVPMTGEQAAAIGLASGRCINCSAVLGGESLSAKVAALIGYGETCAHNNGWRFPKGVAAQRAYIAQHTG